LVMMALVCGGTLNSSAAYFNTAVKGASSGTMNTLKGSLGSDVSVTLNDTFPDMSAQNPFRTMQRFFLPSHSKSVWFL
jgi:hypothetical protein